MPWILTQIDMGCDCCSYVPIGEYDRYEDIREDDIKNPNIEIDYADDDD